MHDFALTEDYYVLPLNPIAFDLENIPLFAVGRAPATDLFDFSADRNCVLKLVPRPHVGGEPVVVDLGRFGVTFHLGPCWLADGQLVAHVLVFDARAAASADVFPNQESPRC